jgi:hypothetical protein
MQNNKKTLIIESPSFKNGGLIPSKFTCDGENINPELRISNVPKEAKSLVLIMDDPDIPEIAKTSYRIDVWEHWTVFNIPPETALIREGENPRGFVGKNTRGKNAYGGPCPPDKAHRYFFKIYALNKMLEIPADSNKAVVEEAMREHIIDSGELIGLYERVHPVK